MPTTPFARLAALLFLLWAAPLHAQLGDQPGYVLLKRVVGEVTVEVKGVSPPAPAVNDQRIAEQTIVTTAAQSSVILVFSNGATVTLGPSSLLDIEEFVQDPFADRQAMNLMAAEPTRSRTHLSLTRGELIGTVRTLNKDEGSSFVVQTPAGAAGIRGTTFRIAYQPAGAGQSEYSLIVLEGEVGFAPLAEALETPNAIVGENQQLLLDVSVDAQTGQVTVLTAAAAMVPEAASLEQLAEMTQTVQQVLEVLRDLELPPIGAPGAGPGNAGAGAGDEAASPAPPVLGRANPDLTPGDGVAGP